MSPVIIIKINFFTNKKKGDVVSRLTSDIQQIENSVINYIRVLFKEPALLLGSLSFINSVEIKSLPNDIAEEEHRIKLMKEAENEVHSKKDFHSFIVNMEMSFEN